MAVGANRTVLLVEDDADNRELMAEVLESSGFGVVAAAGGAEAIALLRARPFDVVVTDVGMPGVGGLEVARAAKAARPDLPVLVVTGYSERDDLTAAEGREIDRLLVKPVDPDALVGAVRDALLGG
jgi:CheY-like chemotaxis protein